MIRAVLFLIVGEIIMGLALAVWLTSDGHAASEPAAPAYATQLDATLRDLIEKQRVPAAVVLVESEQDGAWSAAYGTRALSDDTPVTVDDHFRIGSNTKTMTGTLVFQLIQDGKLALDDPISKFVSGVPNGENITIQHLLNMRSGLYNYSEDEAFNAKLDASPDYVWKPRELLKIAYEHPPYFQPGEGFHYSNTNTILLGLVIEKLTGSSVASALKWRLFSPLKLGHTSFPAASDSSIPDPHPQGYMYGTNVSTLESQVLSPDEQAAVERGELLPNDVTTASPSWTGAAGAAISTAADLARYVRALTDGELLSPELQRLRMDSIQPTDAQNPGTAGYGLGIAKFGPLLGHDGNIPGYSSFMARDPERGLTVIVLTSLSASADGTAPANEIARAIIDQFYGEGASAADSPAQAARATAE